MAMETNSGDCHAESLPTMEEDFQSKEPPRIHRLDESVVNRIAAGEVIQRPVSAVKELVENSLDAHSTSINVIVKDGGLKLIQVSDDGHGISYEDLPILCERHTTSKLSTFEDLQSIKSMGFRGEALASMTYVGHVTVTTITKGQLHGYRVSYRDGAMEHEPKACAAVKGTQIMVENLFYNMIARRKTLQNSADDYSKIVDLLSRFAIHHMHVGFSCRKHGAARADVHAVATSSRADAIRSVYGMSVARSLIKVETSDNDPSSSVFKMDGFISDSNYVAKKITMVLFINDRLVECTPLKRAIEIVYAATLPKASKPFIYMSVILPPEQVDVNVHPTKRELCRIKVSLLNQEVIIDKIQSVVESKLRNSNEVRTFQEQIVEPSPSRSMAMDKDSDFSPSSSGFKSQKIPVHKMVRTDSSDPAGRLHAYMQAKPGGTLEKNPSLAAVRSSVRQRRNPKEAADLTSIQELIDEIDSNFHSGLLDVVRHCTYIGMADDVFALLQHDTHLYLANVVNLSKELMYQQVLRRFSHFNAIQLSEPAPLSELIMLALKEDNLDTEFHENDDLIEKIAEMNTQLLKQKTEMLEEYFSIHIDMHGNLSRLPVVLDQYTPDMDRVPEFVLCLGNDELSVSALKRMSSHCSQTWKHVDWEDEKNCFQSISAAIGNFYAMHPPMLPNPSGGGLQFFKKREPLRNPEDEENKSDNIGEGAVRENEVDHELLSEAETAWAQREWSIQHVLFPSMRLFLKPTTSMATNGTFVRVASLEKLYKIFERC
ncbi:DNA mismatch repair protein MLH1 [Morella rubra]|uniref:DNA mismatch repair protein MLH1 n=1 Tax=Morella rubra TaxID=262757 RepID=A0A6A1UWS9_9ROSI|nr:DNA mismatch repair protein MLH1 [Morella rubra]